jgi:hypothetical protein
MRKPVRSFIREYKSRSSRFIISREMIESVSGSPEKASVNIDSAKYFPQSSSSKAAFDAANAIFQTSLSSDTPAKPEIASEIVTGRVLPCLRQDISHSDEAVADKGPARTRAAKGGATKAARSKPDRSKPIAQKPTTAEMASDIAPTLENGSAVIEEIGSHQKSRLAGRKWPRKKELGPGQKWKRRLTIYAR